MKTLRTAFILLGLLLSLSPLSSAAPAPAAVWTTFDFDSSTAQGWTITGAYDEDGDGPFSHNFSAGWWDHANYPYLGDDYTGDGKGSFMLAALAGHGVSNPGATYWIMRLHSPDLSGSPAWQSARGYSVQIGEQLAILDKIYVNLFVRVYDADQARDRYFYNGTAQPLQHNDWNDLTIDWSGVGTFPTNYIVREVFVNVWGKMSDTVEGAVYLDNVVPLAGAPTPTPSPTSTFSRPTTTLTFILRPTATSTFYLATRTVIATASPTRTSTQTIAPLPTRTATSPSLPTVTRTRTATATSTSVTRTITLEPRPTQTFTTTPKATATPTRTPISSIVPRPTGTPTPTDLAPAGNPICLPLILR